MSRSVLETPPRGLESRPEGLSEEIIPAVPGEFYSYSSIFTEDRPLFVFLKCKANKSRTISSAANLGREANLLFLFRDGLHAELRSVYGAQMDNLLDSDAHFVPFGRTWVAPAGISISDFYKIRSHRNADDVVSVCKRACKGKRNSLVLGTGSIIAAMTDDGKYALFFVGEVTPASVTIDACHILIPE